jgi:YidC/Oxa1 family membrane protein insertase
MDKQSTIAFILIGVILVVWLYFNSPTPQPVKSRKADTTHVQTNTPRQKPVEEKKIVEEKPEENQDTPFAVSNKQENIVTIETDLARIELTSKGAKIRRYFLKKFKTWYHADVKDTNFANQYVQLVNTKKNGGDFNVIFVTKEGKLVNTSSLDFTSSLNNYYYKVSGKDSLSVRYIFTTADGRSIAKDFIFFGNNYASKVNVELDNMQDVISSYRYDVSWSDGLNFVEKNSVDEATQANASVYSADEQTIIDAKKDEKATKDINGKVDWVAVRNKYFAMIIAPDKPSEESGAYFEGTHVQNAQGVREYYNASLKMPFKGEKYQKDSFKLYLGPIDYDILKSYDKNFQIVFDFGSFFGIKFIIRPLSEYILLPLLQFIHKFVSNFGLVIIIFTIIIKFALHPLNKKSLQSMKKMQMLQPKITELKEKFKDDVQKQQQETMKLYSTYGINPMGGCLPMLLQMPILIALWSLLNIAIDIRQQPFVFWITNLSAPDVLFRLPFKIPLFGIDVVSGLALMMGITMFIQQKMTIKDPTQKAMVYVMPVMFTLMFMGLPSGLNLYYFMFNLFSITQQWYINHKSGNVELVPVANPNKKKGFMARMMDAAEKQASTQKKAASKRK